LTADAMEPTAQDAILAALATRPLDPDCFDDAERALLTYADKLTLMPAAIAKDDVQQLRAAGFDDRAIHDACAIVAYFAFVNRIADGLGVDLEDRLR
jgi:uncharacterized peroxidase-related enzyme